MNLQNSNNALCRVDEKMKKKILILQEKENEKKTLE